MLRRTIHGSKDLALEGLSPGDRYLYSVLEENVQACRESLLSSGHSKQQRLNLYNVLNECKDLQFKLISTPQSVEDTADYDIRSFRKPSI